MAWEQPEYSVAPAQILPAKGSDELRPANRLPPRPPVAATKLSATRG